MQYIFENFRYICCVGEVLALDGEPTDVFKNSSFTLQIDVTPNYRSSSYNSSFSQLVPALIAKLKSAYNLLITGPRDLGC